MTLPDSESTHKLENTNDVLPQFAHNRELKISHITPWEESHQNANFTEDLQEEIIQNDDLNNPLQVEDIVISCLKRKGIRY